MCNPDFPDPCMVCCFITDTQLFVNVFHNKLLCHYHFIYDTKKNEIVSAIQQMEIDCSRKNFPQKCFYNAEKSQIYIFYRQGQSFTIFYDPKKGSKSLEDYRFERMTELDLGQMVLFQGEALITRSSSRVLFFKQEKDIATKETTWQKYHELRVRGFIFFIKGNIRI